LLVKKLSF